MKTLLYTHNVNVRIDDINFGKHLDTSKFSALMHDARANFLNSHHLSEGDCFGVALIVLNLQIEYRSQCFFADHLELNVYLDEVRGKKITFSKEIYNKTTGKLAARGTVLMGFFDLDKQKLTNAPQPFIDLLNSFDATIPCSSSE